MADDYSINATITADASGYESGVKKAQKATKTLSKSISGIVQSLGKSGFVGALGAVGLATNGVTSVLGVAKKAFQQVSKSVQECTEAYKKQYKAEIALETVSKNNPFIDGTNVKALKNFASEIQSISNYGDEELLPLIANLTALGRTESETMQIIKTATDMASTGMVSLDTAVNQLNMTLNGNIGRLGVQNAELKDLTEEELKSGKAVEILGKKYEGLAKTTADSSIQLNNAIGDFKELIGETFEKSLTPMRKYFTEIITRTNNAITKAREHKKAIADVFTDDGNVKTASAQTTNLQQSLIDLQKEYEKAYRDQQQYLSLYGQYIDQTTDATALAYERDIKALEDKIKKITDELLIRKKASDEEKKQAEAQKTQAEKEKEIADLKDKYLKKIAEQEAKWNNIELITKENVSNEEKLKFYQEQLVSIMTEAGGQISTNNQYYKDQMKIINDLITKIAETPSASSEWVDKLREQKIEALEDERDRAIEYAEEEGKETYSIWRDYNAKILELKLESLQREKEEELNKEGVTAEDKIAIEEYFANEEKRIYQELGDYKDIQNKKEEKSEQSKFSVMLGYAKDFAKKTSQIFKNIAQSISGAFSTVARFIKTTFGNMKNIFQKLFQFDTDSALDSLLKVEDMILTFFVETLPKLPSFFESAFSSIAVLIQSIIGSIDWEKIKEIIGSIITTFTTYAPNIVSGIVDLFTGIADAVSNVLVENAPQIVTALGDMFFSILDAIPSLITNFLDVAGTYLSEIGKFFTDNAEKLSDDLTEIVSSIIDGISNFITGGGWKNLLNGILAIQNAIQNAIMDNLDSIVDAIIEALPDLIQFITDSIVSASKAMEKILKPMIKLILALVEAIIDVLLSDEVLDAGIEAGFTIMDTIFEELVPRLAYLIPKLIVKIIGFIIKNIPKIVVAMVKGIVKSFVSFPWVQSIKEMFQGFIDGIKDFFGIHSPSTLFESFGEFMIQGLWNGISNLGQWLWDNVVGFFSNLWEGITNVFSNVGEWFSDTFSTAKEGMTNVFENIGNWAVDVWENIKDGFSTVGEWFSDVFKGARAGISSAFDKVGDWASDRWNDIKSGFSNAGEWFKSVFSTAWTNAKAGFSKVGDWASSVWANVKSGFSNVGDWFKTTFTTGWTKAKEGFTNVKDWASGVWSNVKSGFSGVGDWFKSTFSTAWTNIKSAWSGVGDWFKGVADKIKTNFSNCVDNMKSAFSKAGSWVKDMASKIGSGLSKAGEAIKDGASWVGNKIKDFFGFATGTQQAPSGLALVGEAGPELVRFRGGEQVLNARNTQKALEGMGNGRTNNFNVTFNNLQDTSAFAMMNQLKQYNRSLAINGIF